MSPDPLTAAVAARPTDRSVGDAGMPDRSVAEQSVASPTGANRTWPQWVMRPVAIYLASRAVVWLTLAITTLFTHRSIPAEIDRWDSRWFIRAALSGYPHQLPMEHGHVAGNTIAFFPLFPFMIRWLSHLTGLSLLAAGIVITVVTGLTAMVAVWALVRHYADQDVADRATLLLALFPGSLALTLVYSEGLVITCLALGLLALLRRQWVLAGILGLLASAASPIAVAFEVSCLWCAWRALVDRRDWRSLVAPVLAPLGFIGYQLWLWHHTGNLLAWRLTEKGGWNSYPSVRYPIQIIVTFVRDPIAASITGDLLFVGTVAVVIGVVAAVRTRMPAPLFLYGTVAAVLAAVAAPVGLRPRFIFLAFPLIIAAGTWLRGRAYGTLLIVSTLLLVGITVYEVTSWAVFP